MKVVSVDARKSHGTALISGDDSVWVVVAPSLFDLATWLWWWIAPHDKKAWVTLNATGGKTIRARALRIAHKHVRIRGSG
jgi:hypothetical protein